MSNLDDFMSADDSMIKIVRKECSTALSPSRLPGLDFALNPYTRCGHQCTYCYAPYIMRVSPKDWGHDVVAKMNIPQVLAGELTKKKGVIGLGTVTDPYQPIEKELKLTRKCLEELVRADAPVSVLTKSDLVTRDIDLLKQLSKAEVGITITTESDERARIFEGRVTPPSKRLEAVRELIDSGVDTYVFLGPIIPTISDWDLDGLIDRIAHTGTKMIMADRLNLRPGMERTMLDIMEGKDPGRLPELKEKISNDAYYHDIMETISKRCRELSVRFESAF